MFFSTFNLVLVVLSGILQMRKVFAASENLTVDSNTNSDGIL